ncbi:MAG: ATP-binding protein [Planctomycetes bacterium]|nr:ATP-binding protein [Planctomycetota bacterium]
MGRKALIVEDEIPTGQLLAELLRRRGFEPTVMLEGEPAIPWTRQHQPEFILLDLMLPDMDGFSICEQLKLDRETNLVPIIMVTGLAEHKDKVHGLQVGANRYLTKPFTAEQLNAAINDAIAWRDEVQRRGTAGEVHFHLQSDTQYLEEVNQLLASLLLYSGLSEAQVKKLIMAVREMGTNAIEWGHQRQIDRIVTITYRIDAEKVTIVIRDTGPGFDPGHLPHAANEEDPVGHLMVREALGLREGGFGIMLSKGLVDELKYNETGNEVQLIKYCTPRSAPNGPLAAENQGESTRQPAPNP